MRNQQCRQCDARRPVAESKVEGMAEFSGKGRGVGPQRPANLVGATRALGYKDK